MPKPAGKCERALPHRRAQVAAHAKVPPSVAFDEAVIERSIKNATTKKQLNAICRQIIEQAQADWMAETGQPMPRNAEEFHAAAVAEGRDRGLPASSAVIGDYTIDDVRAMQSANRRNRKLLVEEMVNAIHDDKRVGREPTHSTKSKRAELDGYFLGLLRRIAEEQGRDERVVMTQVDAMTDQQFADAILDEFSFTVCARTVNRWRKARQQERQARPPRGPNPVGADDDDHSQDRIGTEEARQYGLSTRSRIDGIVRRSRADREEQDQEQAYRLLEEEGTRLLEENER